MPLLSIAMKKFYKFQSKKLLEPRRIDLGFKLDYLKKKDQNISRASQAYIDHIKILTGGSYVEPNNKDKNSIGKFISIFNSIESNIRDNGFDETISTVPLSKDGMIINGAHRTAAAIYHNKDIYCEYTEVDDQGYDFEYFKKRNINENNLDIAATRFIEYCDDNAYAAIIWPVAYKKINSIINYFDKIIYAKEIDLNRNGAFNLIMQIYFGESWLGSIADNFIGCYDKLNRCFVGDGKLKIIFFQSENLTSVRYLKDEIRKLCKLGKDSIHITDNNIETIRTARLILNKNSLHYLNNGAPYKFNNAQRMVAKFKKMIKDEKIKNEDIIIDGGIILSLYGVRDTADLDYLHIGELNSNKINEFDDHNSEIKYHGVSKQDLIYDENYYYWYDDLKFVSIDQLLEFKRNRMEIKDIEDCKNILPLAKTRIEIRVGDYLFSYYRYYATIIRDNIIIFLSKVKLLNFAKHIFGRRK